MVIVSSDMSKHDMSKTNTTVPAEMVAEWTQLLKSLQGEICDDYRCSDDHSDDTPGMIVTFGFTPAGEENEASWSYQTGDNSFTGGAYGHGTWGVVHLFRDSDCASLANDAAGEIEEQLCY
jgi:hypothetical protein